LVDRVNTILLKTVHDTCWIHPPQNTDTDRPDSQSGEPTQHDCGMTRADLFRAGLGRFVHWAGRTKNWTSRMWFYSIILATNSWLDTDNKLENLLATYMTRNMLYKISLYFLFLPISHKTALDVN